MVEWDFRHHDMHFAASHGTRNRVPNAGLDPRRLVSNDQDVPTVVTLEIRSPIGREAQGKVAAATAKA
jgi:hypothetical protein